MSEVVFRKPPLIEVSFGVKFKPPAEFSSAYVGRFWAQIAKDFSEALDRPPLLEKKAFSMDSGLAPRVWLVHNDKALLIQIQRDRFYVNWRKIGETQKEYPRFSNLRPLFDKYLGEWISFIVSSGLGKLELEGCELSYINFFDQSPKWQGFSDVAKVFVPLGAPQDINATRYASGWSGTYDFPTNRITATLQTLQNVKDTTQKKLQLEIKAEPLLPIKAVADLSSWICTGNEDIVSAFMSLTTGWAQTELWELVQ